MNRVAIFYISITQSLFFFFVQVHAFPDIGIIPQCNANFFLIKVRTVHTLFQIVHKLLVIGHT